MIQLLLALIITLTPIQARQEKIYVKRRRGKSKAILNKQFIYLQTKQKSQTKETQSNLVQFSKPQKTTAKLIRNTSRLRKKSEPSSSKLHHNSKPGSSTTLQDENNWDNYAIEVPEEYSEELSVKAKIK